MIKRLAAIFLVTLILQPVAQGAADLFVHFVEVNDDPRTGQVELRSVSGVIFDTSGADVASWKPTLPPEAEGQLWQEFIIGISGIEPERFHPIHLRIPFTLEREQHVYVFLEDKDDSARKVAALWNTPLVSDEGIQLSTQRIFQLYQESYLAAHPRMASVSRNWDQLRPRDVQAVFTYLKIVFALQRISRGVIQPPPEAVAASDWLVEAISNKPQLAERALGAVALATDVVKLMRSDKAYWMGRLWELIVGIRDCSTSLARFQAFLEETRAKGLEADLFAVERLSLTTIVTSRNQCLVTEAKRTGLNAWKSELQTALIETTELLNTVNKDESKKKLRSDKLVIEDLLKAGKP